MSFLEYGFAYGEEGRVLHGKKVMSALTTGGSEEAYQTGVRELSKHYGGDQSVYISITWQHLQNLETLLREDLKRQHLDNDDAWDIAGPKKD